MFYVLGAPGSGKTYLAPELRAALPGWLVLDFDGPMDAAEGLAGRSIRHHPELWPPYEDLVRHLVESAAGVPTLLLTVLTPDEASGWPPGRWALLDCPDDERARRLRARGESDADIAAALADAADYRRLRLPEVDSVDAVARLAVTR